MKKVCSIVFIFLFFTLATLTSFAQENKVQEFSSPENISKLKALNYEINKPDSTSRTWLNAAGIIKNLNIKPNSQIVDIGAGEGYFTFPLATTLNGTGKVYATEIDKEKLSRIETKAKELSLDNVKTILVSPIGLDPFYKKNSFDLVFMCETFYLMKNRVQYFKELLPSLKKNGKVCIIDPKYNLNFSAYVDPNLNFMFMDIFNFLKSRGPEFPILKRLNDKSKDFILNWKDDGVTAIPINIRNNFITDLNNMLEDRTLLFDLMNFYYPETKNFFAWGTIQMLCPEDNGIMNWLTLRLMQNRVFDDSSYKLTTEDSENLFKLNFLLIRSILKLPKDELLKKPTPSLNIFLGKKGIVNILSSAGYDLTEEYDLPYDIMLIFKATKKTVN